MFVVSRHNEVSKTPSVRKIRRPGIMICGPPLSLIQATSLPGPNADEWHRGCSILVDSFPVNLLTLMVVLNSDTSFFHCSVRDLNLLDSLIDCNSCLCARRVNDRELHRREASPATNRPEHWFSRNHHWTQHLDCKSHQSLLSHMLVLAVLKIERP